MENEAHTFVCGQDGRKKKKTHFHSRTEIYFFYFFYYVYHQCRIVCTAVGFLLVRIAIQHSIKTSERTVKAYANINRFRLFSRARRGPTIRRLARDNVSALQLNARTDGGGRRVIPPTQT